MICVVCSTEKSKEAFAFRNKLKQIYHKKCRDCQNLYVQNHYKNNKSKYLAKAKRQRKSDRDFIHSLKATNPCADCGVRYPYYVMDFDHKEDKLFNLSQSNSKGIKIIIAEIEKCDIVCSNCHRERTMQRLRGVTE